MKKPVLIHLTAIFRIDTMHCPKKKTLKMMKEIAMKIPVLKEKVETITSEPPQAPQ